MLPIFINKVITSEQLLTLNPIINDQLCIKQKLYLLNDTRLTLSNVLACSVNSDYVTKFTLHQFNC